MSDSYSFLLQLAIIAPLFVGILLFFGKRMGLSTSKGVAGIGFIVPALIALFLWAKYDPALASESGYAFMSRTNLGLQNTLGISLFLGLNGISVPLFALAGIVGLAAGLHAIFSKAERLTCYLQLLLIMQGGLMGVFASIDIFFFYFFHELALIPTFIMIGIWGNQGRRTAAMEMTIYLTLGAMISLLGLILIYAAAGFNANVGFDLIELKARLADGIDSDWQYWIWGLLMIGFGILVSLFPFHSWAPRGYASAPTGAAMLHAGVLKKFGLYGLIQIGAVLVPEGVAQWETFLIVLALGNIVIIGLVTIAQRDLKQMIGYSSVMHMGYCFLGIVTMSTIGIGGAVMLMFAHGLSVALMFVLATAVFNRTKTYDMHAMGGLGQKAPILAGFFVAATMASIGLPGFANFWGEFTVFVALADEYFWALVPAVAGVVISAIYGLRATARVFFGPQTDSLKASMAGSDVKDIEAYERVPAIILLGTLLFVGLWPRSISTDINHALAQESVFSNPTAKQASIENLDTQTVAAIEE